MEEFGQERSVQAAVAPAPSLSTAPNQDSASAWDRRTWLVAIPLALVVVYAFLPSLDNGFVWWDDYQTFLDNPHFRGLGAAQVKWAWRTMWNGLYHPLAWMFFEAQYVLWQLDPRGYHLTSLLLQVVNAVVLYVLTVALLVRCRTDSCLERPWTCSWSAGLATALFAVHPLRVEVVAWATVQPYLSCALFSMLAVLAYLRAFPRDSCQPRRGWLVGSFFLFVAALLFLPVAVSLPAVLLILDVYPLRRFPDSTGRWFGASARRALLEKVPFVMVSPLFMGLAIAAKPQSRITFQHYDASIGIARACYGIWFYIRKTLLPLDLIALYPVPKELNWLAPPFSLCVLATLAMSVGSFLLRRRWPGLLASWLSYLVILAPNSGIVWISDEIAADRYSYMSVLGSVMLAAGGLCWLWQMSLRWRPGAIGIIALGFGAILGLAALTRNQCRTWLNSETLWTHALAHGASSSPVVHNYVAFTLDSKGNYREAGAHYAEAIRLQPGNAGAHHNLGVILFGRGKYEEAGDQFTEALRLNPGYADAHNFLAMVLFRQRRHAEAEAHFSEALRLNPGNTDIRNNLGTVLARQGRHGEAEAHFAEAIRLSPGLATAHFNLGLIHAGQGRYEAAEAEYAKAIRLHPGYVGAHLSLGNVLSCLGKYEAAKARYAEAIRLDPGFAEAYNASALLMAACAEAKFRDGKGAVAFATRACELTKRKDPRFLDTLAAAQAEAGDFDAAVKSQESAIELLTDQQQKGDYRSRLVLYQAKKGGPTGRPDGHTSVR